MDTAFRSPLDLDRGADNTDPLPITGNGVKVALKGGTGSWPNFWFGAGAFEALIEVTAARLLHKV
jgi:hypothetical protein